MASSAGLRRIATAPECLTIEWEDGRTSEFASLWLRDNVREDRDPHNGQRLVDITDLPEKPRIRAAAAAGGVVRIDWEDDARGACFEVDWLPPHPFGPGQRRPELAPRGWLGGAGLLAPRDFGWASLTEAREDSRVRLTWLTRLLQEGLAFLSGVPAQETALLEAMPSVGRVLETNYGLTFDVRSVPQPENLAYSDLGLGLHTDNPYREPVPGFQVLHALVASPDGGESLFGDGFAIAEHLRTVSPDAFAVLTRTPVPFRYRSKDAELYAERPLIQLSCSGEVSAVHYNSRSIAPLRLAARDARPFYSAYRRF